MARLCAHPRCLEELTINQNHADCKRCGDKFCYEHLLYPKPSPIRAVCHKCQNELTALYLTEEAYVECMACFVPLIIPVDADATLAACDSCIAQNEEDPTILKLR